MSEPTTERGFVVKDSGAREEFATGSRRDTQEGKPRFDLLPVEALRRWAAHMARGAEKYGEDNWTLGQPLRRYEASALRHMYAYIAGDQAEDHLAAVMFNVGAIIHHEAAIESGRLPASLDDRPECRREPVEFFEALYPEAGKPPAPRFAPGVRVRIVGPSISGAQHRPDGYEAVISAPSEGAWWIAEVDDETRLVGIYPSEALEVVAV